MAQPMTYERAVALVQEIADALGGEQAQALRTLMKYADRGRRLSKTAMMGVGTATHSAQHFVKAKEELERGLEEIHATTRTIARVAADIPDDRETDPPPPSTDPSSSGPKTE